MFLFDTTDIKVPSTSISTSISETKLCSYFFFNWKVEDEKKNQGQFEEGLLCNLNLGLRKHQLLGLEFF